MIDVRLVPGNPEFRIQNKIITAKKQPTEMLEILILNSGFRPENI